MWKKVALGGSALVVAVLACAGLAFWYITSDLGRMIAWFGTPSSSFAEQTRPEAPDYRTESAWALHPKGDGVAAFYVHPTLYLMGSQWNASLDDSQLNGVIDDQVLPGQAGAFDKCCDVFAPRYRQAIFHSFMVKDDNAKAALDVAYSDVLAAFEVFLTEVGDRPFIIAGHSQGALHTTRLVEERVSGRAIQDRLVAAYLVGYPVPERVGDVPVCRSATQTGCAVGWNTMEASASAWMDMLVWNGGWTTNTEASICVNPLNWKVGGEAKAAANLGSILPNGLMSGDEIVPALTGARCDGGRLLITPPERGDFSILMGDNEDDWHVYDYALFFANIEANAVQRVAAWHDIH